MTSPLALIEAEQRMARQALAKPSAQQTLVIAGAGGMLGNEVTQQLLAMAQYKQVQVLAKDAFRTPIPHLDTHLTPVQDWQATPAPVADTAVVMFEPGRAYHQREKSLWTPTPEQLLPLATWLRSGGVTTLLVVLPHQPNRLPPALQQGLSNLDEYAVTQLGFHHLVLIRSAQKPSAPHQPQLPWGERIASWVFKALAYMIPSAEQPLRAEHIGQFVVTTVQQLVGHPSGTFVAGQVVLNQTRKRTHDQVVSQWLGRNP